MRKPLPLPVRPTPYMSVVPERRPEQKAHMSIGHAKSAVGAKLNNYGHGSSYDMAIYEWKDNGWELLYDVPKGTSVAPWHEESEKERVVRAAAAQERARVAEERRVKAAAKKAYTEYLKEHESCGISRSEAFLDAFESGYYLGKTGDIG